MNKLAKVVASFGALALIAVPAMPVGATEITVTQEDITAKLESAVAGDVLLLQNGNYPLLTIDKEITISAAEGADEVVLAGATIKAKNVTIEGVTFETEGKNAIVLDSAENVTIRNNEFKGAFSRAIEGNSVEVSNLSIVSNTFTGATVEDNHDIYIQGTGSGVNVTGNNLDGIVQLRGNANDARLEDANMSNNTFKAEANEDTAHTMMMAMYVDGLTVNNNEATLAEGVIKPIGDAISLNGGVSDAEITGNTINGFLDGISSWTSRYFATPDAISNDINITNNKISNAVRAGILVSGGTNAVSIADNTITGGKYGTLISVSADNEVNSDIEVAGGNTISNASEAAIYVHEKAVAGKVKVVTNTNTFINNKANIVVENDADLVEEVQEPVEIPGEPTEPGQDAETEPEAPTTDDEADITAPNTGTSVANAALVIVGAIVAVLTAVYAARFADAKK